MARLRRGDGCSVYDFDSQCCKFGTPQTRMNPTWLFTTLFAQNSYCSKLVSAIHVIAQRRSWLRKNWLMRNWNCGFGPVLVRGRVCCTACCLTLGGATLFRFLTETYHFYIGCKLIGFPHQLSQSLPPPASALLPSSHDVSLIPKLSPPMSELVAIGS